MEERVTSLEAKIDAIADLRSMIGDLRVDMNRRFDQVDRRCEQVDRRLEILDQRVERHFLWLVRIQMTVLIAIVAPLIGAYPK